MKKAPEINPFTTNLRIQVKEIIVKNPLSTRDIEIDNRVSIYSNPKVLQLLINAPASSQQLFFYICTYLGENRETILLKADLYMHRTGFSKRTLSRAIEGLLNWCIVPKGRRDVYFINPEVLFRGSRVLFYKDMLEVVDSNSDIRILRDRGYLPERDTESAKNLRITASEQEAIEAEGYLSEPR